MHTHQSPRRSPRLTALFAAPALATMALVAPATAGQLHVSTDGSAHATSGQTETRSLATGTGQRRTAFKATSWWNTPLGAAPVDRHSAAYIRDSKNPAHTQNYLRLVLGDWGMPFYRADASDPLFRIRPSNGPTLRVHIPARARPMPTSDAEIAVVDRASGQAISLHGARYNRAEHKWTAQGSSRYWLRSRGIEESLRGGTAGNRGHRGLPSPVRLVTKREVLAGAIHHRLEVYWWETASSTPQGRDAYFPMSHSEGGKTGVVPEGIVVRIKRSVNLKAKHLSPAALVVARALQRYGAVVGDNSGSGNSLKLQANADWTGLLNKDSLRSIPWRDFEFVRGGYRP